MKHNITGIVLKKLLDDNNMNASLLEDKITASRATIGRIIKGEAKPREATLKEISEYFNVPVSYLRTGNETMEHLEHKKREHAPSQEEIDNFIDFLFTKRKYYEDNPFYQIFEKEIRTDESKKTMIELLKKKLASEE